MNKNISPSEPRRQRKLLAAIRRRCLDEMQTSAGVHCADQGAETAHSRIRHRTRLFRRPSSIPYDPPWRIAARAAGPSPFQPAGAIACGTSSSRFYERIRFRHPPAVQAGHQRMDYVPICLDFKYVQQCAGLCRGHRSRHPNAAIPERRRPRNDCSARRHFSVPYGGSGIIRSGLGECNGTIPSGQANRRPSRG